MTRETEHHFSNSRGERLAATVHAPVATPARGTAVVAHGMMSSRSSPKHRRICAELATAGWVALRFDFTGRGESEGDPESLTVSREVEDLRSALAEARRLSPARALVVVGSSLGGTVAVLAAASEALSGLVTLSAPAELARGPRNGWGPALPDGRVEVTPGSFVRSELFDDAVRHDPIARAANVRCPWLVIHGGRDEVIPVGHAHRFHQAAADARLAVHPEADHRFSDPRHLDWLVHRVRRFIVEECARSAT